MMPTGTGTRARQPRCCVWCCALAAKHGKKVDEYAGGHRFYCLHSYKKCSVQAFVCCHLHCLGFLAYQSTRLKPTLSTVRRLL